MRSLMVVFDIAWFVFFQLLKVGGLTAAIWYFAVVGDQKTSSGLIDLRAFTQSIVGHNIQSKIKKDRLKVNNLEQYQRTFGRPDTY